MKSNIVKDIWTGDIELELMPSQFRYLSCNQSDDSCTEDAHILEDAIPFFGLILAMLGGMGIISAFSSPFSLHGGLLYLLVGLAISLTYSESARNCLRSTVPSGIFSILYDK